MQSENYNGRFDSTYLSQLAKDTTAEETVHFIYENIVDFESFISSELTQRHSFLVIKIAVKIKDALPLQKRNAIFAKICTRKFLENLIKSDNRSEINYREFFNNIINLIEHFINHSQLQINIDIINNVMLACEKIAKKNPTSLNDIGKKIEKIRENLNKPQEGIKPQLGSRESYRTISIYPLVEDFEQKHFDSYKSLSKNIVEGSYKNIEHYLNVQFHLLREDFVSPLRTGINSYKRLVDPWQGGSKEEDSSVHIYKGVRVLSAFCGKEQTAEITYRIQLDRNYCRKIKWENTKRFMFGSLVMFSSDDFKSFQLAVISERDVNSLRKGVLSVKLVGRNVFGSKIHRDQYVMAESDAFFEPVYQTLKILQSLKCLPMEKYFLVHDVSPKRPSYMSLGSVIELGNHEFNPNNDFNWPGHTSLNMNESQYAALKASLRQEFVVIQGPPGTGKTFLALNTSKILLENFQSATPLLLLAYTNHALDQFLEGTLKFTKRVVRIGGQSQNKILDQYNLQKIKAELFRNNNRARGKRINWYTLKSEYGEEEEVHVDWPKTFDRSFPILKRELNQSYLEILVDTELSRTIDGKLGLVNILLFHNRMGLNDSTAIGNYDDFLVWLLGDSYETIKSLMKNVGDREKNDENIDEEGESSKGRNLLGHSEDESLLSSEFVKELRRHVCLTFEDLECVLTMLENRQSYNNADHIRILRSVIVNIRNGLNSNVRMKSFNDYNPFRNDLWSLPSHERWNLYNIWVERIRMDIVRNLETKKEAHAQKSSQIKEIRTKGDLELLAELKPEIIGITTTGAGRLQHLLSCLAPRIVIVEEAAQVLEAHIVSSLPPSCEHLILIGDHKQLRPSPSTYDLARWFGLDVSLFERMLNNGVCCKTLNVQHRMKPNIAALIAPSIYPDLTSHPSVSLYPPILGVSKNLFFIDHKILERNNLGSEGRCNPHEAEFMIALCRYLILQGYQASDIVILTTYCSQQFLLRGLQKKEKLLEDVRITVVDNYQGEECKIVLLSLVRSNREGSIGFLGAENRICVALSRAKHGLYIIGNMQLLKTRSTLWHQINTTLQVQQAIGEGLTLFCQVHKVETRVQIASEFKHMKHAECSRNRDVCPTQLPCGHFCSPIGKTSHINHAAYKCLEPCKRKVCTMHLCPLPCSVPCTGCQIKVNRVLPQCGHIASMPCMKNPNEFACTLKINGVVCSDIDKLNDKRIKGHGTINLESPAIFKQKQLDAEKRQEEQLAARKRQEEQLAARKRQEEQLASRKRQEEQLAARKLQEEQLAARKLQEEQLAARKLQEEQLAARKLQEEQLAARKLQEEQLAARKLQEEQLAARKLQEEQLAARKLQEEQLAARKHQVYVQDLVLARYLQEQQSRLAEQGLLVHDRQQEHYSVRPYQSQTRQVEEQVSDSESNNTFSRRKVLKIILVIIIISIILFICVFFKKNKFI